MSPPPSYRMFSPSRLAIWDPPVGFPFGRVWPPKWNSLPSLFFDDALPSWFVCFCFFSFLTTPPALDPPASSPMDIVFTMDPFLNGLTPFPEFCS